MQLGLSDTEILISWIRMYFCIRGLVVDQGSGIKLYVLSSEVKFIDDESPFIFHISEPGETHQSMLSLKKACSLYKESWKNGHYLILTKVLYNNST